MKNLGIMFDEILNKIEFYDKIIIKRHVSPDPDAIGSQLGLKEIIEKSYPNKKIYAVGEEESSLEFMGRMDSIADNVYDDSLIIVLDTSGTDRVSLGDKLTLGSYIIKIDHHLDLSPYGDISWVDTDMSSASEMILKLVEVSKGKLTLNIESAKNLYLGLVGDTGRFMYNNTSSETLRFASELLKYNIDAPKLLDMLYKTSKDEIKLKGHILLNSEVNEYGVAYYKLTKQMLKEFNTSENVAAGLVNMLKDTQGNKVWACFIESDEGIRVELRSSEIEINSVAVQFGGGGHSLASGASVANWESVVDVINALNEKVEKNFSM